MITPCVLTGVATMSNVSGAEAASVSLKLFTKGNIDEPFCANVYVLVVTSKEYISFVSELRIRVLTACRINGHSSLPYSQRHWRIFHPGNF